MTAPADPTTADPATAPEATRVDARSGRTISIVLVATYSSIEALGALVDWRVWLGHTVLVPLLLWPSAPSSTGRPVRTAIAAASLLRLLGLAIPGAGLGITTRTAAVGAAVLVVVLCAFRAGSGRAATPAPAGWRPQVGVAAIGLPLGLLAYLAARPDADAPGSALALVATVLTAAVLAGAAEELLFRGLVHRSLGHLGPRVAVAASTTVFVAAHLGHRSFAVAAVAALTGAAFAVAVDRTGSLVGVVGAHAVMDVVGLVVLPLI